MASEVTLENSVIYRGYTIKIFREQQVSFEDSGRYCACYDVFYFTRIYDKEGLKINISEGENMPQTIETAKKLIDKWENNGLST